MSDLQPYLSADASLLRDARRAGRMISRYQAQTQVRIASTDNDTDVVLAKVESATAAAGQAMAAVTHVAQLQKQLELLAPEASGRLSALADGHAICLVELMADHQRMLRRR